MRCFSLLDEAASDASEKGRKDSKIGSEMVRCQELASGLGAARNVEAALYSCEVTPIGQAPLPSRRFVMHEEQMPWVLCRCPVP